MDEKTLPEVIKSSNVVIHKGRYAYLKLPPNAQLKPSRHFLVANDQDETTIVTEEKNIASLKYEKEVKWFTLIEIRVSLPFLAKGFIAATSRTLP